jgi:hypothetical protein
MLDTLKKTALDSTCSPGNCKQVNRERQPPN